MRGLVGGTLVLAGAGAVQLGVTWGVAHALGILNDELERGLALMGVTSPAALTRAHVERVDRPRT